MISVQSSPSRSLLRYTVILKNKTMTKRLNCQENVQSALKALYPLGAYLAKSSIEERLLNLIYYRVSQLNGCSFCLDMHSKDLRAAGETEQRLYVLDGWREAPFYSPRERAAFAWAESLTRLQGIVPDAIYEEARKQFSEQELIDLTLAVITINSYNRFNLAFPNPEVVGTYEPGQFAHA
jgi:AhpD family alkylhydroperoxidase